MQQKARSIWWNIWLRPKESLQKVLDTDPNKHLVTLTIIHGFFVGLYLVFSLLTMRVLEIAQSIGLGVLLVVGSIIFSLFILFFISCLYQITGKWIKGEGTYIEVKSAVGWSFYPQIVSLFFVILSILVLAITSSTIASFILMVIGNILGIWSLVLFFLMLGQAHKFSAWKALLCYLLALLVIIVAVCIIFLVIKALSPLFF